MKFRTSLLRLIAAAITLKSNKGDNYQLADLAGMHIRQLQKYEKGITRLPNMTVKNAIALAKAPEIPIESFLEEDE